MGKPTWKKNGIEDKFLLQLSKDNKITKYTKPTDLIKEHAAVFGDFSLDVIRNHLKIFKKKIGVVLISDEMEVQNKNEEGLADVVKECSSSMQYDADDQIIHLNQPFIMNTFKDPETQVEKVLVIVNVFSGATDVNIDVNETGDLITIKYKWTKTLFDMNDLFKSKLEKKEKCFELISTVQNELKKIRKNIKDAPLGIMKIKLPITVQTGYNTWTKTGIKRDDGTRIIIIIFTGIVEDYSKTEADTSVLFE